MYNLNIKPIHIAIIGSIITLILVGVFVFSTNSTELNDSFTANKLSPTEEIIPSKKVRQNMPPTSTGKPIVPSKNITTPTSQTDITSPQAFILEPKDNAVVTLGTDVKIVANVTDNVKVDRVEFYAGSGDYQLIGTVRKAPFEVIWNVDNRFENSVNIPVYIKAFDTSGNRADSSILVRAKNP
ncbi:MAG: hypothetical protein COU09_02650 [Candidatus Harrisonbacteria bacterium CG10_big_fil_rev_8_21_14_0_10_44_23]|uniref:Bacterial Ig-like domain-containing protein n=1 Tax=Candidatus Harrisonbacteria bacterium CG10_big_fil_rev_8_21_14_0_10_44_23 TaxID=1974585 RepID=A0A2H0UPR5_9BACT|nr:MAG: hypothetical protein COU09_02650 [Candidatus Harrisonbacteria bacterium CG10_big_fil_rev_8_21_14_0_10_44_23]